jgi:hypothetical protein
MSLYQDLTEYTYHNSMFHRPGTKNVGWLAQGHDFRTAEPTEDVLRTSWNFCKISIARMRGTYECDLCSNTTSYYAQRDGEGLLLGSSEIRVFSAQGEIYAAPNLIYHYIAVHRYAPPDAFLRALDENPPPSQQYFERLTALKLDWEHTRTATEPPERFGVERDASGALIRKVYRRD